MKKVAFMFVAIAAMSFASCGNKTATGEAIDSLEETIDSLVEEVDSTFEEVDSVVAETVEAVEEAVVAE